MLETRQGRRPFGRQAMLALLAIGACLLVGQTATLAQVSDSLSPPPLLSACEVDYPPYCVVDSQGRAGGFSVDLLNAALAAMGHTATYRIGPWAEVRGWLEQGKVQVLPLVGRTPEREALFDFTFPYMSLHGAIVVRQQSKQIQQLSDLQGRCVAVMKGDNAEEFLRRQERGFEIRTTATFDEALRLLSRGGCDAVVVQRLVALRLLQQLKLKNLRIVNRPIDGFRQDFCFGVKDGDSKTLALLNEGLALVMADGTYRHLHAKWFAALELPSNRRVVIGGDHNFPPYEYVDEHGRPAGLAVDLVRGIAREMDLEVEFRLGPWEQVLESFERGEIDVMEGMFYSPERDLKFDFTQPYAANHYVSVVGSADDAPPVTFEQLAGKRLVVQAGDLIHAQLLQQGLAKQLTTVASQEEVLREVVEGRQECGIVVRFSALVLMEQNGWQGLRLGKSPLVSADYCCAVRDGDKALLATFSEGLKVLQASGEYRRLHDKWLGVHDPAPPDLRVILRYVAMVAVPLVVLALAFFGWSWSLRRQVELRTREACESERLLATIIDAIAAPVFYKDREGVCLGCNQAFSDLLGLPREAIIGKLPFEYTDAERAQRYYDADQILMASGKSEVYEAGIRSQAGERRQVIIHKAPFRDQNGEIMGIVGAMLDITEHKRAEEALHKSNELQRAIVACSPLPIFSLDPEGSVLTWNAAAERVFGWTAAESIGEPAPIIPAGYQEEFAQLRARILAGEQFSGLELVRQHKDGRLLDVSVSTAPLRDAAGEVVAIMATVEDVTERKRAELTLRQFKTIFDTASFGAAIADLQGTLTYVNECLATTHGYTAAEVVGQPINLLHNEEQLAQVEHLMGQMRREGFFQAEEVWHTRRDGSVFPMLMSGMLVRDAAGVPQSLTVTAIDLTERKALENQLQQIQKMESIGRLAGGVAHDFNNMLTVILGQAQLVLMKLDAASPVRASLVEIERTAKRSAALTQQLLAFARKQTIAPTVLDLNATVEGMLKMLRRLVGEDLEMAWLPHPGLWPVKMDPAQVDQLLANLCVNAREAIEGVGTVTIETSNVSFDEAYCANHAEFVPGDYVLLAVSDDGCGMDKATLSNIFEPFFTTKSMNQGTGLGLATVYGVVKQNNGFINVYSEPGKGTTFRLYLPRYSGHDQEHVENEPVEIMLGHGECVLLVEDDPGIMEMGQTMLRELGYEVLIASGPAEALRVAAAHAGPLDLLVTDVVMPETDGRRLAEQLSAQHPRLKTLFMSGYTANVIAHRGVLDEGVMFMQKPFAFETLAAKVREALDQA